MRIYNLDLHDKAATVQKETLCEIKNKILHFSAQKTRIFFQQNPRLTDNIYDTTRRQGYS